MTRKAYIHFVDEAVQTRLHGQYAAAAGLYVKAMGEANQGSEERTAAFVEAMECSYIALRDEPRARHCVVEIMGEATRLMPRA